MLLKAVVLVEAITRDDACQILNLTVSTLDQLKNQSAAPHIYVGQLYIEIYE